MFTPPFSSTLIAGKNWTFPLFNGSWFTLTPADHVAPPSVDLCNTTSASLPAGARFLSDATTYIHPLRGPPERSTPILGKPFTLTPQPLKEFALIPFISYALSVTAHDVPPVVDLAN